MPCEEWKMNENIDLMINVRCVCMSLFFVCLSNKSGTFVCVCILMQFKWYLILMITIIVDILIQNMTLTNDRLKHSVSYPLLALGISTSESHPRECSTSRFNQSRGKLCTQKACISCTPMCLYFFHTLFPSKFSRMFGLLLVEALVKNYH